MPKNEDFSMQAASGETNAQEEDLPDAFHVTVSKEVSHPLRNQDIIHSRRHCQSFRLILSHQFRSRSNKMAAALRRIFKSREKTQGEKSKKEGQEQRDKSADSISDPLTVGSSPSAPKRLFSYSLYTDGGRIRPAGCSPKLSASRDEVQSPLNSKKVSLSVGNGFRRACDPLLTESNAKHIKLVRTRRLMKEFQELQKAQKQIVDPMFTVELVNDNLYEWKVKIRKIDTESGLYRDMQEFGIPHILLGLSFPDNFPFQPPFLRVLAPRLEKGFVMEGGAICMELLTPRGWASAYTIEAIIMQFSASLVKGQGLRMFAPSFFARTDFYCKKKFLQVLNAEHTSSSKPLFIFNEN